MIDKQHETQRIPRATVITHKTIRVLQGDFTRDLLQWYEKNARQGLIWKDHKRQWKREQRAYYTLVSEVMLQQTQVQRVQEYFPRYIAAFGDIATLASADEDAVLKLWQGLGYYRRARNLHKAAQIIYQQHQGHIPDTVEALESLPGIGKSTAHAILAQVDNKPLAIADANVIRVLTRLYGIEQPIKQSRVITIIWQLAQQHTPENRSSAYTQAIMDFGALLCKPNPICSKCFARQYCFASLESKTECIPQRIKIQRKRVRLFFPLLVVNGQLLMEQRIDYTIWQGMWSLPQFSSLLTLQAFARHHRLEYVPQPKQKIKMKWLLTHREMVLRGFVFKAQDPIKHINAKNCRYVPLELLSDLATPAPFTRLMQQAHIV